jgi:hypothetical protein
MHIWNAPLAGEIAMALSPKKLMEIAFRLSGLPGMLLSRKRLHGAHTCADQFSLRRRASIGWRLGRKP